VIAEIGIFPLTRPFDTSPLAEEIFAPIFDQLEAETDPALLLELLNNVNFIIRHTIESGDVGHPLQCLLH
jgi:hypothetical protein